MLRLTASLRIAPLAIAALLLLGASPCPDKVQETNRQQAWQRVQTQVLEEGMEGLRVFAHPEQFQGGQQIDSWMR